MRLRFPRNSGSGGRGMPVQRFRSFDEARRALWLPVGDPSLPRRLRALWKMAGRLAPRTAPRGLFRFRSLEEAGLQREEWVSQRLRVSEPAREAFERHVEALGRFERWESRQPAPSPPADLMARLSTLCELVLAAGDAREEDPEREGIRRMHQALAVLSGAP